MDQGSKIPRGKMPTDGSRNRGPRDLADGKETEIGIPVIAPPKEVEAALGTVPAETRNVAVAKDLTNGAKPDDRELPLFFGVLRPVSKDVLGLTRLPRILGIGGDDLLHRVFRRYVAIEVENRVFKFHLAFTDDWKPFGIEVVVLPIVVAGDNHLVEAHVVVNDVTTEFRRKCSELEGATNSKPVAERCLFFEDVAEDATCESQLEATRSDPFLFQQFDELLGLS